MSIKLRILCVISALCFLGSVACFSGYAAEIFYHSSGDEEVPADPGYVEPEPVYPDPEPVYPDPEPVTPNPDPGTVSQDPVVDPTQSTVSQEPTYSDPGTVSTEPADPNNVSQDPSNSSPTVSDVISDGNYPQDTFSTRIDDASEYNQYIENINQAKYDDNYLYIPSYTAPTEKLIETSSKIVDTDELTAEDWAKIILDLDDGNISDDGSKTFSFIKDNEEEGDTSIEWMLYLGVALIVLSIFTVIFVIISTSKANEKFNYA